MLVWEKNELMSNMQSHASVQAALNKSALAAAPSAKPVSSQCAGQVQT